MMADQEKLTFLAALLGCAIVRMTTKSRSRPRWLHYSTRYPPVA